MAAGQAPPPSPRWPWWAIPSASATPPRHPPAGRGGPRGQPAAQRGDSARVLQHLEEWVLRGADVHLNKACTTSSAARRQGLPGAPGQCRQSAGDRGAPARWGRGPPPLRLHHPYPGRPPRPAGGRLRPHAGGRGPLQRRRPGRDGGAGRPGGRPAPGGEEGGPEGLLSGDGTHYTPEGTPCSPSGRRLRPAGLTVHRYRSREAPPEGPDGRRVQGG